MCLHDASGVEMGRHRSLSAGYSDPKPACHFFLARLVTVAPVDDLIFVPVLYFYQLFYHTPERCNQDFEVRRLGDALGSQSVAKALLFPIPECLSSSRDGPVRDAPEGVLPSGRSGIVINHKERGRNPRLQSWVEG